MTIVQGRDIKRATQTAQPFVKLYVGVVTEYVARWLEYGLRR